MAEARAAYRSLFRSLSKHVSPDAGSKWHTFARKEFNRLAKVGDPVAMQQALQTAKDYADLVSSIQSHKELLLSYNIGLDREKTQMEGVHRTAARVGLQVPKQPWH